MDEFLWACLFFYACGYFIPRVDILSLVRLLILPNAMRNVRNIV